MKSAALKFQSDVNFADRSSPQDIKSLYAENGFVILKNFLQDSDLEPIRESLFRLINHQRSLVGLSEISASSRCLFDEGILELCERNRECGGAIYRAARTLLEIHQLSVDERIMEVSKNLMQTDFVMCSANKDLRMDFPGEDKYLFPWHQDYPYSLGSSNGLVYWIPLRPVGEFNGSLSVIPGSHKAGLRKVHVLSDEVAQSRAHTIRIADEESSVDSKSALRVSMDPGDVLVFSNMLIHKSNPNSSDSIRWTLQFRVNDFNDQEAAKRGWVCNPGRHNEFLKYHADKVV